MNYYEILEINKGSSLDDIKKSYRRLALKWHPDRNKDNKYEAEEKFKKISEAYNVLSNNRLRQKYDMYGNENVNEIIDNDFDPFDIFNSFFDTNNSNFNHFSSNNFNDIFNDRRFYNSNSSVSFSSRQESSKILNGQHIKETIIKDNDTVTEIYEINGQIKSKKITKDGNCKVYNYDNKGKLIKDK